MPLCTSVTSHTNVKPALVSPLPTSLAEPVRVRATPSAPVVVLGGSKQSPEQLLSSTREALTAGAKGVAVGRNVWQSVDPGSITASLVEAVHG